MRLTNNELESIVFDFSVAYMNENVPESQIYSVERRKEEYNEWSKKDDMLYNAIQKLGQLEDIEEELGIDLILFFKVLKSENLYWKWEDGKIREADGKSFNFEKKTIDLYNDSWERFIGYIADYGKTWALTKEELE